MTEPTCFRCGEEIEPNFDICWNCCAVLRSAPAGNGVPEVVITEVALADQPRRQFRLRQLFLWTTIAAVLCGVFTSAAGPFVATWLLIVGIWLSFGLGMAVLLMLLVYISTSPWSPFALWRFMELVADEKGSDDGVPVDVCHWRQSRFSPDQASEDDE